MTQSRSWKVLAVSGGAVALASAVALVAPPAAQAAADSLTCNTSIQGTLYNLMANEVLTLTFTTGTRACDGDVTIAAGLPDGTLVFTAGTGGTTVTAGSAPAPFSVTGLTQVVYTAGATSKSAAVQFSIAFTGGGGRNVTTSTFAGSGGGGGGGASAAAVSESPSPILQQYGRPASGVCDPDFTPEWARLSGAPDGGWGPSWATWISGTTGREVGPVCTRTLIYSDAQSRWVIG